MSRIRKDSLRPLSDIEKKELIHVSQSRTDEASRVGSAPKIMTT